MLTGDGAKEIRAMFAQKPENFLDAVCEYMDAGFFEDALAVLELAGEDWPLLDYYRASCRKALGEEYQSWLRTGAFKNTGTCFPARLEDIAVLELAIRENPEDANACYYLGCLYYDRFRYDEAVACWEEAVRRKGDHGKALRCLSIAYFDKYHDPASARMCMERAMAAKNDPRLLFEYQQLLKNSNVSAEQRLAVYDDYPALLEQRDDCYLDKIVLLCCLGRYEEAAAMAKRKHFHIYEGGEGQLTKQHAWLYVLYGNEKAAQGSWRKRSSSTGKA